MPTGRFPIHQRNALIAGVFLALLLAAVVTNPPWRRFGSVGSVEELAEAVDRVLDDPLLEPAHVGVRIVSLDHDEVLYDRDGGKLFHPASNQKLLTSLTAVSVLPPEFRIATTASSTETIGGDGVLPNDLYLAGRGDPDLRATDLGRLAARLAAAGLTSVHGDIVFDDAYFADPLDGPGRRWNTTARRSWTPIRALTVDDNRLRVAVTAGAAAGDSLLYELTPPARHIRVLNQGATVADGTAIAEDLKIRRHWDGGTDGVRISGNLAVGDPGSTVYVDVLDGSEHGGRLFAASLAEQGVTITGDVRAGVAPAEAVVLARHLSDPAPSVVRRALKSSDTLSAELLLRILGAVDSGDRGSVPSGLAVVRKTLDDLVGQESGYRLADGSGISRYNLVSPRFMTDLLAATARDPRLGPWLHDSLPVAGVDGTLAGRMLGTAAARNLRAKTGTLRSVSCLSGYVTSADGERLAFSMMMTQYLASTRSIREIQDRLGALMAGFRREWREE